MKLSRIPLRIFEFQKANSLHKILDNDHFDTNFERTVPLDMVKQIFK